MLVPLVGVLGAEVFETFLLDVRVPDVEVLEMLVLLVDVLVQPERCFMWKYLKSLCLMYVHLLLKCWRCSYRWRMC